MMPVYGWRLFGRWQSPAVVAGTAGLSVALAAGLSAALLYSDWAQGSLACMPDAILAGGAEVPHPLIEELLSRPSEYEGHCVIISGRITKINGNSVVLEGYGLRPIQVVLAPSARGDIALDERLIVAGTVERRKEGPTVYAEQARIDDFLGGGCC